MCLVNSMYSIWYRIVKLVNKSLINRIPLFLKGDPEVFLGMRERLSGTYFAVKVVPYILNDIEIGAVWWPIQNIYTILLKPCLDNLGCVLWIVVLLEVE